MANPTTRATELSERGLVMARVFNAPRELVFKVWTDPKHVIHWWGPTGFTNTIQEMDVRPGGKWKLIMHGPNGVDYPNVISYEEVVKPERLVWSHGSDIPNDPGEFQVTVRFEDLGEKTRITMEMLFKSAAAREKVVKEHGAIEGNKQTMDRLEAYLAKLSL